MSAQRILVMGFLLLAAWGIGRATAPSSPAQQPGFFPAAQAAEIVSGVSDGEIFISTDGGNAYMWQRWEDRIVLLGLCSSIKGPTGQASYIWNPGVEKRS
jgi:hypothetical protein